MTMNRVWEEVKAQNPGASLEELSQMEADYRQLLQQKNELESIDPEYANAMEDGWSNGFGLDMEGLDSDFGMNKLDSGMSSSRYDDNGLPALAPYAFGASVYFSLILLRPMWIETPPLS